MRLYYGGYGHHPSGKQYEYWGGDNFRTGQNVVVPVTNRRTGRTYNTMFTIMRTGSADAKMASNEAQRLSQKGIGIKMIAGTDVLGMLTSGSDFKSKREWKDDSERRYDEMLDARVRNRLLGMEV